MATTKNRSSSRLRITFAMGAILALLTPACVAEGVLEAQQAECASGDCLGTTTPDGDDPFTFCDDHDPCTTDANCTPCSTVPAAEQDEYHCTADQDLPSFCEGRTGCVHVPMTTPAGVSDSCFPVADSTDLHAGVCRAGTCVENGS
jgi:hypothetical protein